MSPHVTAVIVHLSRACLEHTKQGELHFSMMLALTVVAPLHDYSKLTEGYWPAGHMSCHKGSLFSCRYWLLSHDAALMVHAIV
jgi:hypothetical protein